MTFYFNPNQKPNMLLRKQELQQSVTTDRTQTIKHDVLTRWHSRLGAMSTFLVHYADIKDVAEELQFPVSRISRLSVQGRNTLAEFITVLTNVRCVARIIEADREITMF